LKGLKKLNLVVLASVAMVECLLMFMTILDGEAGGEVKVGRRHILAVTEVVAFRMNNWG
jgi:hypothetical protein